MISRLCDQPWLASLDSSKWLLAYRACRAAALRGEQASHRAEQARVRGQEHTGDTKLATAASSRHRALPFSSPFHQVVLKLRSQHAVSPHLLGEDFLCESEVLNGTGSSG